MMSQLGTLRVTTGTFAPIIEPITSLSGLVMHLRIEYGVVNVGRYFSGR